MQQKLLKIPKDDWFRYTDPWKIMSFIDEAENGYGDSGTIKYNFHKYLQSSSSDFYAKF